MEKSNLLKLSLKTMFFLARLKTTAIAKIKLEACRASCNKKLLSTWNSEDSTQIQSASEASFASMKVK